MAFIASHFTNANKYLDLLLHILVDMDAGDTGIIIHIKQSFCLDECYIHNQIRG